MFMKDMKVNCRLNSKFHIYFYDYNHSNDCMKFGCPFWHDIILDGNK